MQLQFTNLFIHYLVLDSVQRGCSGILMVKTPLFQTRWNKTYTTRWAFAFIWNLNQQTSYATVLDGSTITKSNWQRSQTLVSA